MQQLKRELESLHRNILDYYDVAQLDELEDSGEELEPIEEELTEMLLPGAFERHLLDFMQAEKEAFQDPESDRDDPLCSCGRAFCPIKQAKLPAKVTMADDLDDGIGAYLREHNGDGAVIREARKAWVKKGAGVRQGLRRALGLIRRTPGTKDDDESGESKVSTNGATV